MKCHATTIVACPKLKRWQMPDNNLMSTILIVDDDQTIIEMLTSVLEGEGYRTLAANMGEAAIVLCEQAAPDLILLDVMMSDMNGFDTCRRLKKLQTTKEIPVIFMTALTAIEDKVEGFKVGGVDYVTKPLAIDEVLARINNHIFIRNIHKLLESQNRLLQQEVADRKQKESHIRTLSLKLMKAQEDERRRISFDLHDEIAQDLAMLKISVDTALKGQKEVPEATREMISRFSKALKAIITSVRELAYNLRFPLLEEFGLVTTVSRLSEDFSKKSGLRIDFVYSEAIKVRFDVDTEINLLRLVQEALNNIRKHAHASFVRIELALASSKIELRIEDDGRGFDVNDCLIAAEDWKSMGLQSMKERISLLGGEFHIQSSPLHGTKLFITVPVMQGDNSSVKGHE